MKHKIFSVLLAIIVIIPFYSCSKSIEIISKEKKDLTETIKIKSKALSENEIQNNGERTIRIDLPPDYHTSGKKYPVVYYFHGYGGSAQEAAKAGIIKMLHNHFLKNKSSSFILVSIDGNNKFGGSFYVNSKVAGNWEDHFISEIIPLIDKSYRTIPEKSSRALAGFSMGGFGVLHIGLSHPEYFSGIWALCPGIFAPDNGFKDAYSTWKDWPSVKQAYGAAFANDSKNYPKPDDSDEDELKKKWLNGYGGWAGRINQYKKAESKLKIKIINGKNDFFKWINKGSKYLYDELKSNNINVERNEYQIGHQLSERVFKKDALKFFQTVLKNSQ